MCIICEKSLYFRASSGHPQPNRTQATRIIFRAATSAYASRVNIATSTFLLLHERKPNSFFLVLWNYYLVELLSLELLFLVLWKFLVIKIELNVEQNCRVAVMQEKVRRRNVPALAR